MLGYLDDKAKTDEVIVMLDDKRWYKTGDKGHLDENGFLTIVDRYSRFAKVGGEMISLTSVEEKIRHVLGKPELELVAMNVPDKKKGEKIVLLLAEETSMDELRKSLLDDNTSPLMIPSEIVIDSNIPILGSGKTDFKAARELILNAIQ